MKKLIQSIVVRIGGTGRKAFSIYIIYIYIYIYYTKQSKVALYNAVSHTSLGGNQGGGWGVGWARGCGWTHIYYTRQSKMELFNTFCHLLYTNLYYHLLLDLCYWIKSDPIDPVLLGVDTQGRDTRHINLNHPAHKSLNMKPTWGTCRLCKYNIWTKAKAD